MKLEKKRKIMKNKKFYTQDCEDYFNKKILSSNTKKNKLNNFGLENKRIESFKEYKSLFDINKLEKLKPSPILYDANQKKSPGYYYYHLYSKKINNDLFLELTTSKNGEREEALCPACQLSESGVFDHYVPRSIYPLLSMNPINLIPWCSDCNVKKGEAWLESGNRLFLNFYIDKIPKLQFLYVRLIKYENNTPFFKYYLNKPDNMPKKLYKLIENHFEKLDLIFRYEKIQSDTYNDLLDELDSHSSKESILKWIERKTNQYGYNNYKIVLWSFCVQNTLLSNILKLK